MKYSDMLQAVDDAETTLRFADLTAKRVAKLLVGRLRTVDNEYTLKALKQELSEFNARTGEWKT